MVNFDQKLDTIMARADEITALMSENPDGETFVKLSKELSSLEDVVKVGKEYKKVQTDLVGAEQLIHDSGSDEEMKKMAEEEYYSLKEKLPELEKQIQLLLLPKDEADDKNVILEIRAGTGGEEAALFGGDLLRMYERYAGLHHWKWEILSLGDTGLGGVKEAVVQISGNGVFARLKYESGVHRVQRVPETEASGRVHTSAATVVNT